MKKVFIVQTQHDGLMTTGLTNVKALFGYLRENFNLGEICPYDSYTPEEFTYSNLLKEIKLNQSSNKFYVAQLIDTDKQEINVMELTVFSSYFY